jgi:hypothetical protein
MTKLAAINNIVATHSSADTAADAVNNRRRLTRSFYPDSWARRRVGNGGRAPFAGTKIASGLIISGILFLALQESANRGVLPQSGDDQTSHSNRPRDYVMRGMENLANHDEP